MIKAGVNIHNKFEIEVRDSRTGEITQRAEAYNIVLNGMYTQLCNFAAYFTNICFGTGTGTLSNTRTTLFSYLGYKAAADDTLIKAMPVSSWKRKIVLNPEEYVGSTITEVGISNTSPSVLTHALLKDSEGNQISITKKDTDVITIYATVYVTFSTQDETKIKFAGMPSSNSLVNYLIGGSTFPSHAFYLGENDGAINITNKAVESKSVLGTSSSVPLANWIKDAANKKVTTPTIRFATTAGNGNIAEIGFGSGLTTPLFRSILPITGVFEGQSYTGISVGTGDGVTKDFILPSKNIKQDSIAMKVDGVVNSAITKTLISNAINFAYADPATLPTGQGNGCAITPDGKVLAVAHQTSPYISTYDWDGSAWIRRPDPATLPPYTAYCCALSPDGNILVVGHNTSPYLTTYDWNGSAWIKRPDPATLPTNDVRGCAITPDGKVLVVGINSTSPYMMTYDWNGSAWIKRANPATLPAGSVFGCAFSSDGKILAVAHSTSPYITTYDWDGSAWIKRANPATLPTGGGFGCALSPDGNVLVVASSSSPYIIVYDWDGSAWIKRANPATLPTGGGNGCALSPDGNFMGITSTGSPYIFTYDMKKRQTKITFDTAPATGSAITADYTVNGIHKTDQYVVDVAFSLQFGEVV